MEPGGAQWRLTAPMYEVRSTMYDLESSRAKRASVAKQMRGLSREGDDRT